VAPGGGHQQPGRAQASEKTPLTAFALADILYEAGLPPEMLSVLTGDPAEIADELLTNADVDLVTFTGGVSAGSTLPPRRYTKAPGAGTGRERSIIVLEDADLEEAAALARAAPTRIGQRCTAVKRVSVQESVADRFVDLLVERTRAVRYGDPFDPTMDMGTVIDEPSARRFEAVVNEARRRAPDC